jgi:hypothetical protein
MSTATTSRKLIITARRKLARATKAVRRVAAYPLAVGEDQRKPEEYANLQANIPFGFLFLNRH